MKSIFSTVWIDGREVHAAGCTLRASMDLVKVPIGNPIPTHRGSEADLTMPVAVARGLYKKIASMERFSFAVAEGNSVTIAENLLCTYQLQPCLDEATCSMDFKHGKPLRIITLAEWEKERGAAVKASAKPILNEAFDTWQSDAVRQGCNPGQREFIRVLLDAIEAKPEIREFITELASGTSTALRMLDMFFESGVFKTN